MVQPPCTNFSAPPGSSITPSSETNSVTNIFLILVPAVVKIDDSILVCLGSYKFQLPHASNVFEQRFSSAKNYRIDVEPVFVDQVMIHERRGKAGTSEQYHVLAWLFFQLGDLFCNVIFDYSCILPISLLQ